MKGFYKVFEWVFAFFFEFCAIGMFATGDMALIGGVFALALGFFMTPVFDKLIGREDMLEKAIIGKIAVGVVLMFVIVGVLYPD